MNTALGQELLLGTAEAGFQTFVMQVIWRCCSICHEEFPGEIGTGTYTASGTTLTRSPGENGSGGSAVSLGEVAQKFRLQ